MWVINLLLSGTICTFVPMIRAVVQKHLFYHCSIKTSLTGGSPERSFFMVKGYRNRELISSSATNLQTVTVSDKSIDPRHQIEDLSLNRSAKFASFYSVCKKISFLKIVKGRHTQIVEHPCVLNSESFFNKGYLSFLS